MPATTNIGGFYASLGLNPDKASFESGMKLINSTADSFNKLIGAARNAAVVLAMDKLGASEAKLNRTSKTIGVTTEAMKVWSTAARIAGVNAEGVLGSMNKLANVINRQKYDAGAVTALTEKLGLLGIKYKEINELSADKGMKLILQRAQEAVNAGATLSEVAWKVEDILGSDAMDLFVTMMQKGLTPDQMLAGAGNKIYTGAGDNEAATKFNAEFSEFKTTVRNIAEALGIKGEKLVTPYIEKINNWFDNNGNKIKTAIDNIYNVADKTIGTSVKIIGDWWKTNGDTVKDKLEELVAGLQLIFGWITSEKGQSTIKKIFGLGKNSFSTTWEMSKMMWQGNMQGAGMRFLQGIGDMWDGIKGIVNPTESTQDGIMRPDGTVVQVAPDDWVFAARDVGNMARAFIPQTPVQTGNSEYVINQEITINGGNDLPQVLRQQAFNGAHDGLLAAMAQSSNRLQQMSGTR